MLCITHKQGVFREVDSVVNTARNLFTRMKSVELATTDDDDITPPYLLEEVVELLTNQADIVGVRDVLVRKLKERSPNVKFKALRVIRHCCVRSIDFRRAMQKQVHKRSCRL